MLSMSRLREFPPSREILLWLIRPVEPRIARLGRVQGQGLQW